MSTPGQQELPAFRRNEVSFNKQQPSDYTLESYPSHSQSVGKTTSRTHQPSVSQIHSNYLPHHAGLPTESPSNETASGPNVETKKELDTTESVRKIEPMQDTTQAPQMDSPIIDKTLARNQTSVYKTSLNSNSSVDETSNHLLENETSTSNLELPITDKPSPSSYPPMGTAPLNSHPPFDEPPSSHHSPKDDTSPSKQPPISYISSISSHSPVDGSRPSQHTPTDGTSFSNHPEPLIIAGTSTSNHPVGDKTANGKCLPMGEPPPSKHHLIDFSDSQQSVDDSLPETHPSVEVPSRTSNYPDESNLQIKNEFPASNDDQTPSNYLPVCKTSSEFFSSQLSSNIAQPPADGKPRDKHTQHKTPFISREKVCNMQVNSLCVHIDC